MTVFGIDIGFGFTKATDGKEFLMFKSLLGSAEEIPFFADLEKESFIHHLHVTVDGTDHFVGDLAEKQSEARRFTLDQKELSGDFAKILSLTVAGLFFKKTESVKVVSGLPVSFFPKYKETFAKTLLGEHEVLFHQPEQETVKRTFNIARVRMVPQAVGSALHLLMDSQGILEKSGLAKKKLGIIDVGMRTTDFVLFDRLQYVHRGSRTQELAMADAYKMIAERVKNKTAVDVELFRLYDPIQAGSIRVRGQEFSLSRIKEAVYSQIAGQLADHANKLWEKEWDLEAVMLTGGGSTELGRYLEPLLSCEVISLPDDQDPRLNNVRGYRKFAHHLWGAPEKQS